jgi:hypothetical protein
MLTNEWQKFKTAPAIGITFVEVIKKNGLQAEL